jgi:hypothetical protein
MFSGNTRDHSTHRLVANRIPLLEIAVIQYRMVDEIVAWSVGP